MRTVRIEGADPKPLGAPADWDEEKLGHCGALFIRREVVGGVHYMRSAWESELTEAQMMACGGRLVLGIAGHEHPVVHLQVTPPPEDAQPVYASQRVIHTSGRPAARLDAFFPHGGGRRCFCEVLLNDETFAAAVAVGIEQCDALARREGWIA